MRAVNDDAIRRGSGSQYAYAELRERILSLELAPGTRLFEENLASSLGVSRTPLREALRQLVSENLLERHPTGGVAVPALDAGEIRELYDVRAALEGLMAGEAAAKATADDIIRFESIVSRNAALVGFPDEAMRFGQALHTAIGELAANRWALHLHHQVVSQMERYKRYTNRSETRRHVALEQHTALVRLIAAHDVEGASRLAQLHVATARDEAVSAVSRRLDA